MTTKIPETLQIWIAARKRFGLSHAQVQMARELGMNPRKLGGLDDHRQEPWKMPLPDFIEHLYFKSFAKRVPDCMLSFEDRFRDIEEKKAARHTAKVARKQDGTDLDRP